MSTAIGSSLGIVAFLALFAVVGVVFLLFSLVVGKLVRPKNFHDEKLEIYECGEPSIGSSFVQFDLRFYVVALLFIIFDVEVAFFFPWATVFGKATHLMDGRPTNQVVQRIEGELQLTPTATALYREMGVRQPTAPRAVPASLQATLPASADELTTSSSIVKSGARQLAVLTLFDIGAFFGVLMVGFAYVWVRGDLDWVRAVSGERARAVAAAAGARGPTDLEELAAAS